jgi:Ice-binding-like
MTTRRFRVGRSTRNNDRSNGRFSPLRGIIATAGLACALTFPSPGWAQATINLGQAGNYGFFEVSNGLSSGKVTDTGSKLVGSVALGANTSLTATSGLFQGSIYEDTKATFNNVLQTSKVTGQIVANTSLSTATTNATQASAAAAALTSKTGSAAMLTHTPTSYTFTGWATNVPNFYTFSSALNLAGATININGSANQQFVLNFANGFSFTGVTINLSGGLTAQNLIFNVTGGSVAMTGSTFLGTLLDLSKNSVSITGSSVQGSVIANGNVSLTGGSIVASSSGSSSGGGDPPTVSAPESPTIVMAGLACLAAAGSGLYRRRQRKLACALELHSSN